METKTCIASIAVGRGQCLVRVKRYWPVATEPDVKSSLAR